MKIVGVSACTVGIAHTYMAQQKLEDAAKAAGDEVKIETQGTIGVENELTAQDIADADIVILAIDVKVSTETAIKAPNKLIAKLHEIAEK